MQGDYILSAVKGIKKSIDDAMGMKITEYKDTRLVNITNTSEWSENFISTEAMSGVKKLAENETPPTLKLNEGRSVIITPDRFGGAIEVTQDDRIRMGDNTTLINEFLMKQREQLMVTGWNQFLGDMFYLYNNAFNSSASTLAPDGVELCGTHSWATTGSTTWSNKGTEALDMGAIDTMETFGGSFTDAEDRPMPVDYDTIVVKKGSAAAREARRLFAMNISPTAVADVNIYKGEKTVIETPWITNALHWFGLDTKYTLPLYVGILKSPSMDEPIVQNNNAIRSNMTAYYKVGITNLPYRVYGSTGTT